MKLEFYRHIFEKFSNIKFHENPSMLTDGQTNRRDEVNSRFSQFCEKRLKRILCTNFMNCWRISILRYLKVV